MWSEEDKGWAHGWCVNAPQLTHMKHTLEQTNSRPSHSYSSHHSILTLLWRPTLPLINPREHLMGAWRQPDTCLLSFSAPSCWSFCHWQSDRQRSKRERLTDYRTAVARCAHSYLQITSTGWHWWFFFSEKNNERLGSGLLTALDPLFSTVELVATLDSIRTTWHSILNYTWRLECERESVTVYV